MLSDVPIFFDYNLVLFLFKIAGEVIMSSLLFMFFLYLVLKLMVSNPRKYSLSGLTRETVINLIDQKS